MLLRQSGRHARVFVRGTWDAGWTRRVAAMAGPQSTRGLPQQANASAYVPPLVLRVSLMPSPGFHGRPRRCSMYSRIRRRTTCEGVWSSPAHSRSNTSFLRGSINMVNLAVRFSSFMWQSSCAGVYIECAQYDNQTSMLVKDLVRRVAKCNQVVM